MFSGPIRDRNELAKILLAPGGEKLSTDAAQILATIVMEKRPYYVGDKNEPREFPRESRDGIVKSVSHCHSVNQGLIREKDQLQLALGQAKLLFSVIGIVNAFLGLVAGLLALLK